VVTLARLIYASRMVDAIDPARLGRLPADVRAAFEAQAKALAETFGALDQERSARRRFELKTSQLVAEKSNLAAENAFLKEANSRLEHLVQELRRARFGPRSEKLNPDQQQLVFEDIEIAIAEVQEFVGRRPGASDETNVKRPQRRSRALPKELPQIERVIEPASIACPCGCGTMVKIGEDRSERLDITPAQLRVIVTIRPRYACPKGRAGVTQAPAPAQLSEAGLPTEALIAHVIVSKYSEHLPLYRQAQIFARHGVARTLNLGRLGGARRFSSGAYRRADGRIAQTLQQTLHGRDHRSGPRSGTRQDQDRLSMGAGARRSSVRRHRSAGRRISLRARARRHACGRDARRL
jgi:transposase